MKRFSVPLALLAWCIAMAPASAQPEPFDPLEKGLGLRVTFADLGKVTVEVTPKEAKPGQTVRVKLTVIPELGGWTYPVNPKDAEQPGKNYLTWEPWVAELIFVGGIIDPPNPKTKPRPDQPTPMEYYSEPVSWILNAVVSPRATPGLKKVPLAGSSVQICGIVNGREVCVNTSKDEMPPAEITVLDGPPVQVDPKYAPIIDKLLNPPPSGAAVPEGLPRVTSPQAGRKELAADPHKKFAVPPQEYQKQLDAIAAKLDLSDLDGVSQKKSGLLAFLLTAVTWGFISLVTPCVFPMIPITVSIFMKQANQSRAQTMKLASIYCLTIILVLGVSAISLLKLFVDLSVSPWMNLFLGGLFVFFALSLLGMYDITLPKWLLRFTQSKQGAGGVVGTVFGAVAFTIVSFTCVAPFLGGFAGMAASGNYTTFELVLGGLAFAAAFAFPFFLLALFPSLLKALPRSGGWLGSVKVVMGFLEIAAALKFLRTAEIGWESPTNYFTYDLVLGAWVAIFFATGLYLLNVFRLPHDEERPTIGVPRVGFALFFLSLAVSLAPALLPGPDGKRHRPSGVVYAWIDAFLLPDASVEFAVDLQAAMERAKAAKKPVFIDFTGQQCTNCRFNENSVFTRPQVWALMEKYERVQLYAQYEVPKEHFFDAPSDSDRFEEGQLNRSFKDKLFGTDQLPLYVILLPQSDGRWKARVYPEGKINDIEAFKKFLTAGLGVRSPGAP